MIISISDTVDSLKEGSELLFCGDLTSFCKWMDEKDGAMHIAMYLATVHAAVVLAS